MLKKREAYREAFDRFDPNKVALYGDAKIEELMGNDGIIRNRLKINSEKYGSFDKFRWEYVDHTPITNHWGRIEEVPAKTPLSDKISNDLKKMGFKFVGSTIIYSFMQAVGMVNDHISSCFVYEELLKEQPHN